MSIPFKQPVQLATTPPGDSWKRPELLAACTAVAAKLSVRGTFTLTQERDHALTFASHLTSKLAEQPVIIHYSLPIRTHGIETDRVHTVAEAIAELAFLAADGHDSEQGELIRLLGLADAVELVAASKPDVI